MVFGRGGARYIVYDLVLLCGVVTDFERAGLPFDYHLSSSLPLLVVHDGSGFS